MNEQMSFGIEAIPIPNEQAKQKRKWENAFQKWSDSNGMSDGAESWGACGYGSMCDYCEDNSYGRPCVRALNAMLRETGKHIDYTDFDFVKVWEDGGIRFGGTRACVIY